ncbi:hypothetical protein ACFFK0_24965 [Paenibacillus chartarius]|uniref:DivIVA domain-containing protein n=1 Tax=Paenibacillus chartarius TaxID=747481 RepID=A0ABV6DSM4_9BACL
MSGKGSPLVWREALRQLFADAGYEREELLHMIESYEQLAADFAALLAENERLRGEAALRKAQPETGPHHMSSKLWEAIHE